MLMTSSARIHPSKEKVKHHCFICSYDKKVNFWKPFCNLQGCLSRPCSTRKNCNGCSKCFEAVNRGVQ